MIEIVSATRLSESEFWQRSALGMSLQRLDYDERITANITFGNAVGLPLIYNARIQHSTTDILVFMHDDVWIDDFDFGNAVCTGLAAYNVIGIAGNRQRRPLQGSWYHQDTQSWIKDDARNLSGSVAHGPEAFGEIAHYGTVPASCELLDGVFLAVTRQTLIQHHLRFDPRFEFHFYDLDFCRSAHQAELDLGTWPIALTHQSVGAFGTEHWFQKYKAYIEKWGE